MTSGRDREWQTRSSAEIRQLDGDRAVAILPVGAIEQHGPHLPLGVDAMINQGIINRALDRIPGELQVLVLPMLPIGKSDEHISFKGTLTLSAETLIRLWTEIGVSVARSGIKKLILFNSHGGQVAIMDIVARDLRIRETMLVMAYSWFAVGIPEDLFPDEEIKFGIHAGAIETSMMLHLHPDLVDMAKAENFEPMMAGMKGEGYRRLTPVGAGRMGWKAEDLQSSGACGNAAAADAEKGRLLVEHAAEVLVELLIEMDRYPLSRLVEGSSFE
ncbi:MAG: creatininase family protein [Geminicoccaceae bacterium]